MERARVAFDRAGRRRPRSRRRRSRGSAFTAIVLPLLILAAIAASVTQGTRTGLLVVRTHETEVQSRLAAEAGIAMAILELIDPEGDAFTADGSVYKRRFAGLDVEIAVQNESAKINLNHTPNAPLERLLVLSCLGKSEAARLAERIADYADEDDSPRPLGAERTDYARLGRGHGPANRRFETLGELLRVPGVTTDTLSRIRPFVTAQGYHDTPELRLASRRTVMSVLDVDEPTAGAARERAPGSRTGAAVGVFTLTARVTSPSRPPGATEAIVYVTGDRAAPARILDWRGHSETEPVTAGCATGAGEGD